MFERFTEKAIKVVMLAQEETRRLGHKEVGTGELLLGLILKETGLASRVLRTVGVNLENARLEVEKIRGRGSDIRFNEHDFSDDFRQVVYELSLEEANQLKHREIATEHLLLGLLREEEGTAIKILQNLGVKPTQVRTQVISMLAAQGDKNAAQILQNTSTDSSETNRIKYYLDFIQKLLSYPESSEVKFLKNYPNLFNSGLMIALEGVASILEQQGDHKGSKYLREITVQPTKKEDEKSSTESINQVVAVPDLPPVIELPESDDITNPKEQLEQITNVQNHTLEDTQKFLFQLLRVIFESKADSQVVYPFLEGNLGKLNERFPEVLRDWATDQLSRVGEEQKPKLAKRITTLSTLIRKFERGDHATNLEIALTGYEIVDNILTEAEDSISWAANQYCLGLTYLERSQGNPEQNLKQAINCFTEALKVYDKDNFPQQRKLILNNLKNATREMRNIEELDEHNSSDDLIENIDNEANISDKFSNSTGDSSSQTHFLLQVIETIERSDGNFKLLYLLLQENIDKLDNNLACVLKNWAIPALADAEPEEAQHIATIINFFGEFLIIQFQQGDATNILEIARTSFEIAATVFTEVEFPEQSAEIQDRLCLTFLFRVFLVIGESQEDLQSVYFLLQDNRDKLNDRFIRVLRDWGTTQLSLAGNLAFASHKSLSHNFAQALLLFGFLMYGIYQDDDRFSQADKEITIEICIACCEVVVTFFTRAAYPPDWAFIQYTLGGIYCDRIRGDRSQNLKLAQQYLQATLEVFAAPEFAEQRIQVQEQVDRVKQLQERGNSEANDNSERTEVAESYVVQESQEVQIYENIEERTELMFSSSSNNQESQEREQLSDEDFKSIFESFFKDISLEDTDIEKTAPEFVISQLENSTQEESSIEDQDESEAIKEFRQFLAQRRAEFNEKLNRMISNPNKKIDKNFTELSSYQTENDPLLAAIQSNPELMAILRSVFLRIVEKWSTILEARGERNAAEMMKDVSVELSSGEIFANLTSDCENTNTEPSLISSNIPELTELFNSPEFAEVIAKINVELFAIAPTNYTDADDAKNMIFKEKVIEVLWTRLLPLMSKFASTSELLNNDKLNQFFEQYSTNSLAAHFHKYENFWGDVIEAIFKSEDNPEEVVYPFFLANLDKLNSFSTLFVSNLVKYAYSKPNSEEAGELASLLSKLTPLLQEFPHGNKAEQIEIAIAFNLAAIEVIAPKVSLQAYAFIHVLLGPCYHQRIRGDRAKNLEEAINCYKKASEVFTQEISFYFWAINLMHLGNAYQERIWGESAENNELAIKAYHEALDAPEFKTQHPEMWAMTQINLGHAYRDRTKNIRTWEDKEKNLEDAITCYKNALSIFKYEAFPKEWAMSQTGLAAAYRQKRQSAEIDGLKDASGIFQELLQRVYTRETFPEQWAMTQINLGMVYRESKNLEQAINCLQNALHIFKRTTNPENYLKILTILGLTYLEAKDFYNAYSSFAFAINTTESLHTEIISGDEIKQDFSEGSSILYQCVIKACLELATTEPHYYDRAIEYVERSKSRSLVELLASRNLLPKGNIPEATLQKLQRLRQEIATEQRRLSNVARQVAANARIAEYGFSFESANPDYAQLNELQQELDSLIDSEIYLIDPNFRLTQKVSPISFSDIKNIIPDNQVAIIEWYIPLPLQRMQAFFPGENISATAADITGGDTIFTFITTFEEEHPIVLQTPLENYVAFFVFLGEYGKEYGDQKKEWANLMPSKLQELARILEIDRIVSCIPNAKQAILIPHKFLHLLPLHALPLKDGSCLLDRFSQGVRYAPNCQVLQLTQGSLKTEFDRFLAIQNPTEDLKYTDVEVQIIQQFFQSNKKVLPGTQATKEAFLSQPLDSRYYLHFSCHGYFNPLMPLQSALFLANCYASHPPTSVDLMRYLPLQDGSVIDLTKCLTLGDTFNLDLRNCRLVTLSACETGLTNTRFAVDEYVSLPSGFLYAGSPNVVASQWTVNDLSTTFLMIKFYENLQEQQQQQGYLNVAIALNQAQLWLRDATKEQLEEWTNKLPLSPTQEEAVYDSFSQMDSGSKPFHSPYYWAAFCSIGQ